MTDQNTFMEVLREVAEIIRTAETPMSEEEIMTYFSDMELTSEQRVLVLDYLNNKSFGEDNRKENSGTIIDNKEAEDGQSGNDAASENSKVLQAYMEDLSLLETYEDEEVMKLYKRLFAGEEEVIEILSTIWLPKVLDVAKSYIDIHEKVEDLIQEGNIALLMRLNQLCGTPDCSDAEKSFHEIEEGLSKAVEKGIMEYISEWDDAKQQENKLVGKLSLVHETERFLEEENGEHPTISQLAAYTNMSVEEIRDLKEFVKK